MLLLAKRILLPSPPHPPSEFRKMSRKASRSVSRRGVGAPSNTTIYKLIKEVDVRDM
jgi:hypothetical protein